MRGCVGLAVMEWFPLYPREDLAAHFPARSLAHEIEEVDKGGSAWTEACFIQFASVVPGCIPAILRSAPNIPLLGGAGAHDPRPLRAQEPKEEEGHVNQHPPAGNHIDARLWPPGRQGVQFPRRWPGHSVPVTTRELYKLPSEIVLQYQAPVLLRMPVDQLNHSALAGELTLVHLKLTLVQ